MTVPTFNELEVGDRIETRFMGTAEVTVAPYNADSTGLEDEVIENGCIQARFVDGPWSTGKNKDVPLELIRQQILKKK
mgnify:CR=1 FL=1